MPKLKRLSLEAATEIVNRAEARYVNKKDFVDKGIEPKIRPVVVALVAHGFSTQNSCEGHLESNLYPWVRLEPGRGARIQTKKAVLKHLRRIHSEIDQLNKHLFEFYNRSSLTPDRVLQAMPDWDTSHQSDLKIAEDYLDERSKRFVAPPGYFLQCAGAEALLYLPSELIGRHRKNILRHRQKDMLAFAKFLVSKI